MHEDLDAVHGERQFQVVKNRVSQNFLGSPDLDGGEEPKEAVFSRQIGDIGEDDLTSDTLIKLALKLIELLKAVLCS